MNWYTDVIKKYATFSGRARRKEYWMYVLFNAIISIVLSVVDNLAGLNSILSGIYLLAVLLPSIAVAVRRLHDTGKSGGWIFIALIPLVGGIILLVFLASEGDRNPNAHGQDPKQVPAFS